MRQGIRIALEGGRSKLIDADVIGLWAVHPDLFDEWTITHVPTGACLPLRFERETDALRVRAALAWGHPNYMRSAAFGGGAKAITAERRAMRETVERARRGAGRSAA